MTTLKEALLADYSALRAEFIRLLTEDSETNDARRREFNQAIFWSESDGGRCIWTSVDLDMVLEKFDKAVKGLTR